MSMNYCKDCKYIKDKYWCTNRENADVSFDPYSGIDRIEYWGYMTIRKKYGLENPCPHYSPNRRMRIRTKIKNLFNRNKQ